MKMSKKRIQSDILKWSLPEEVLPVLLKGRTTVWVLNVHTLCKQLSWSHYRTLITVENEKAQQYYFYETVKRRWTVRELQRQIKEAA
jgi:hypothetical protein